MLSDKGTLGTVSTHSSEGGAEEGGKDGGEDGGDFEADGGRRVPSDRREGVEAQLLELPICVAAHIEGVSSDGERRDASAVEGSKSPVSSHGLHACRDLHACVHACMRACTCMHAPPPSR